MEAHDQLTFPASITNQMKISDNPEEGGKFTLEVPGTHKEALAAIMLFFRGVVLDVTFTRRPGK